MAKKRQAKLPGKKAARKPGRRAKMTGGRRVVAKKRKAKLSKKTAARPPRRRAKTADMADGTVQQPPYKCETTDQAGTCLKFYLNPRTKQYNLPPGGERVNCTECEYYFD